MAEEQRLAAGDTAVDFGADTAVVLAAEIAVGHPEGSADLAVEVSAVVVPAAIGRNKKRLAKPTFLNFLSYRLDILDNHCGSSSSSITNACASNLSVVLFQYVK